jgi:hypothetical protein
MALVNEACAASASRAEDHWVGLTRDAHWVSGAGSERDSESRFLDRVTASLLSRQRGTVRDGSDPVLAASAAAEAKLMSSAYVDRAIQQVRSCSCVAWGLAHGTCSLESYRAVYGGAQNVRLKRDSVVNEFTKYAR